MINEISPLKIANNPKKCQRSTTLESQLSMGILKARNKLFLKLLIFTYFCLHSHHLESGIIDDMASPPDEAHMTEPWMGSL